MDLYLAHLTSPILHEIPGSVKDTGHLLRQLESLGTVPEDTMLFSADVSSLYPSIPWVEGIYQAVDFYHQHAVRS